MAYGEQYIPHSCSERGKCLICEKRISKQRDQERRAERMRAHFEKANAGLLERVRAQ